MLTKYQIVKTIKVTLASGPEKAKEIVEACTKRGAKPPRVFYWLKKLEGMGEIRKVEERYELVKFEEVSKKDINFYIKKIKSKVSDVKMFAIREFMDACRRKKVSHHASVWNFIEEWFKGKKDEKTYAIRFLERIASNPLTLKEEKTIEKLCKFRKDLEEVVLDESMENTCRSNAMFVLEIILTEKEFLDFSLESPEKDKPVFEKLIREASRKGGSMPMCRTMWKILLSAYSRKGELGKLRKLLYGLLEDENKKVRWTAFGLLDELRGDERGLDLKVKI